MSALATKPQVQCPCGKKAIVPYNNVQKDSAWKKRGRKKKSVVDGNGDATPTILTFQATVVVFNAHLAPNRGSRKKVNAVFSNVDVASTKLVFPF